MSNLLSRSSFVAAVSLSALCFSCASDQKSTNTPDNENSMAPGDNSTPAPGDSAMPAPNGEPAAMPPSSAPPQSLNQATPEPVTAGNAFAATKPSADAGTKSQLSEGQVAMVAELANTSEIEQAKLAQAKAKNASVKKFAAMMLKHHTEAKAEQAKLFKQLNLTPAPSQTATSLKQNAEKSSDALRSSAAAGFDQRYIDAQVDAHQQVLDTINGELLPAATDQELISGLNKMKATVEAHLREAKSIQSELAKAPAAQ